MKSKSKNNDVTGSSDLPLPRVGAHRSKAGHRLLDTTAVVPLKQRGLADERFFSLLKAAELLGISDRTVRRWTDGKKLKSHQFGGITRISAIELGCFITRARRGPVPLQPVNPLDQKFYTAESVADTLNVCIRTVRRRIDSGVLVAHDFFGIIRIADSDLDNFIDGSVRD